MKKNLKYDILFKNNLHFFVNIQTIGKVKKKVRNLLSSRHSERSEESVRETIRKRETLTAFYSTT